MDRHDPIRARRPVRRYRLRGRRLRGAHRRGFPRRACRPAADDAARNLCRAGSPGARSDAVIQTVHIVKKALRRLRWLLLLWIAVLAGHLVLRIAGPGLTGDGFQNAIVLRQLSALADMLELLLIGLIAARLVHGGPLVGLNAFWLPRPYSRQSLTLAKLLVAGTALVAAPFAADVVAMSLLGAGPAAQLQAAPSLIAGYLLLTLAFLVIAVLTPSTTAFAFVIVGLIALVAAGLTLLVVVAMLFVEESTGAAPALPDRTPAIIAWATFVVAALSVIAYQYRQRRR